MIGDRLTGVRIEWREWTGGAAHVSHPRSCTGTVEHVGTGTVLIRRPRGGLVLKRLARAVVWDGRLKASLPGTTENLLTAWLDHDMATRNAADARRAAARQRTARKQEADTAPRIRRGACEGCGVDIQSGAMWCTGCWCGVSEPDGYP